jgi:hypothetical protein
MTAATVTEGFQTSLIVDEKEDEKEEEKEQEKRNGKMSRHFTLPAIRRLVSLRRGGVYCWQLIGFTYQRSWQLHQIANNMGTIRVRRTIFNCNF